MNIISYNVRGLGKGVKWPAIRRMVNTQHIDMLCIQETKKETIDRSICQALWGDTEVNWEAQPSLNTAGGILYIWSEKSFVLERKVIGNGFLLLIGMWLQEAVRVHIVNIYSPCDIHNKRLLWDNIKQIKSPASGGLWCMVGDFNSIRQPAERMGVCHKAMEDGTSREFNDWIAEMEVEEAPWVGIKFTWFRPNGTAKTKLDRFLLSPEWFSKWLGTAQYTLDRNFSNHCPLLLRSKCVDWGPKPFRILDCWLTDSSFRETVHQSWSSNQQSGWGGFILKEKIKRLKADIKNWNRDHFGDTLKKYKKIEEDLNKLEEDTIDRPLEPQEVVFRKKLQEELWVAAQSHESLLRQKARSRWIRKGVVIPDTSTC